MLATSNRQAGERQGRAAPELDELELNARVEEITCRRPSVGLAVGVVRGGRFVSFHGRGLADIASNRPITEDAIFRIASITKTFIAIAIMQLWERGMVDLDLPASDYVRAYRLIAASRRHRPATVRHLLTHTAGIPEVVHLSDLLHPGWGPLDARPAVYSVKTGERLPSLAEYYRGGLRLLVEPGSTFAYSNHGFATLGQLVEDVTSQPLDSYLRNQVFEPLGMADTALRRSELVPSRVATGYELGPNGARAIPDRDWITHGASAIYSSTRDMSRFVAALLGGGANEHGSVLKPATLATMFEAHHRPDPRLPGMGLGFFREDYGGHRIVSHDGRLPGFNSQLLLAPDDGVGIIGLTNGSSSAMSWMPIEMGRLLRHLIGASDEPMRTDIPHHPEIWGEICGRYELPPRVSDLRGRLLMSGGAQVMVRGGRPMVRLPGPIPALSRGFPLQPDDERDPYAFRVDLSRFGMPRVRVVFGREGGLLASAMHTDLAMLSFRRSPASRAWRTRGLAAATVVAATVALRRRRHTEDAHAD